MRFGVDGSSMKSSIRATFHVAIVSALLMLTACGHSPAPISTRSPPASEKILHHIVSEGESLYAIAWRYELSPQQLARANGLAHPYTLRVGQRLSLDVSVHSSVSSSTTRISPFGGGTDHTVRKGETLYGIARQYGVSVDQLVNINGLAQPYTLQVGQKLRLKSRSGLSGTVSRKNTSKKSTASVTQNKITPTLPTSGWRWIWPVKGKVTRFYDSHRVFKGINIQSNPGRAVVAAAPGAVVYAGSGLRGYGRLIIVKHSETYLSAYAHNRKMLVKEGDQVSSASKIAEVGGDTSHPGRLYFEIRKNGKPIDPLRLLPTQ